MSQKYCKKCNQTKDYIQFPKEKARKDGHYPWCKVCLSEHRRGSYKRRGKKIRLLNKVCSLCKESKPRGSFKKYDGNSLHYRCIGCEEKLKKIKDRGLKKCNACGRNKKLSNFYNSRRDKHRSICIKCESKYNKQTGKWHYIKKKYGLSQEEWFDIYNRYDGKCYICLRKMSIGGAIKGTRASTDHCHLTGARRLIICNHCNADILPEFEYDIPRLQRVLSYLTTDWQNGFVPQKTQIEDKKNLEKRNIKIDLPSSNP